MVSFRVCERKFALTWIFAQMSNKTDYIQKNSFFSKFRMLLLEQKSHNLPNLTTELNK